MNTFMGMYEVHVGDETFHETVVVRAKDQEAALELMRANERCSDHFVTQAKGLFPITEDESKFLTERVLCEEMEA